jgi:hypothetical protein
MATKKKKKKTSRRRSRRGSMGAVNLQGVGMKVAGIAAAAFADNLARKNLTSINPKILAVVEIGAGVFLPKFVKGPLGEGIADGLIAVGTINLLKSFSVISGVGAVPMYRSVPIGPSRNLRNNYNPSASAIGAGGRPFLNQTVGAMPSMESEMMGALLYED